MEKSEYSDSAKVIPSLIRYIGSNDLAGFDSIEKHSPLSNQILTTFLQISVDDATAKNGGPSQADELQHIYPERMHSVSISMPSSPLTSHIDDFRHANLTGDGEAPHSSTASMVANNTFQTKPPIFRSQPMPINVGAQPPLRNPALDRLRDNRYDTFKTWSGKLERQLSNLRGIPCPETECEASNTEIQHLPVGRYFDALEGPELDTLKDSEELMLPKDKLWPFLLRYPITSFGICLGISGQAVMWKNIATADSTQFLNVSLVVNLILWCISLVLVTIVVFIYACKTIFYFEAVRREYHHPIRVNFFFAPFIVFLFLAIGAPPSVAKNFHESLWYVLMTPILCLEIKIYGQWMSGGKRRLSKVANPSNHLSIVGNFVGAILGASMGLKEGPILFFAIGLAHYVVLFVTLYQRLPTNETLPKELHPVFFLFVAAPSIASVAWAKIAGSFDYGSRMAFFTALFLYFSLAVRINLFRGFRFSLAWWAYTFPMAGAAVATINYSNEVTNLLTQTLAVTLCAIASLTSLSLLVTTIFHAFVLRDLFPNDVGIAISIRRPKTSKKWYDLRRGSSDAKDLEASLKE